MIVITFWFVGLLLIVRIVIGQYYVETIAGTGSASSTGDGSSASLSSINTVFGIWGDSSGNLYLTDFSGARIRKITASNGFISTMIGTGSSFGCNNGNGVNLCAPYGIYGDSNSRYLYFGDDSYFIYQYNFTSEVVIRYAGAVPIPANCYYSGDGGPATSAQLCHPRGLFLSATGLLYFADLSNSRIRVINTANGIVTSFSGNGDFGFSGDNGPALSAELNDPFEVVGNSAGPIYIADYNNNRVRMVSTSGTITTIAGNGSNTGYSNIIEATSSIVYAPVDIKTDSAGNIYVAEQLGCRIRMISSAGLVSTIIGSSACGSTPTSIQLATSMSASNINALWVDSAGNVFFSDSSYYLRKIYHLNPPTSKPSYRPTQIPTTQPSNTPTTQPTNRPSRKPTTQPTNRPSAQPTTQPTTQPSDRPTTQPTNQPTNRPMTKPSTQPSNRPTTQPTAQPNNRPTREPTTQPTNRPSRKPTTQPTNRPTNRPTTKPSMQPSNRPTTQPTNQPTKKPTTNPTTQPSNRPTTQPTVQPNNRPTREPTNQPTNLPSTKPTTQPSNRPTTQPTAQPNNRPTREPTTQPSNRPITQPTNRPSRKPTAQPTTQPSIRPTAQPFNQPTDQPTREPTSQPSNRPITEPTHNPTVPPTTPPTNLPTNLPTTRPTNRPTAQPADQSTVPPTTQPTNRPTTQLPTNRPAAQPTNPPTLQPTTQPTNRPTRIPSGQPSSLPSLGPTAHPSTLPFSVPSSKPSLRPSSPPTSIPTVRAIVTTYESTI